MRRASERLIHPASRRLTRRPRRVGVAAFALAIGLLVAPEVAHADAAGPTDYRTEVLAITPATDAISVSIEGGDSFVGITVTEGHEAIVLGYDDEPYLRIATDGTISENLRSFATYYNAQRYGADEIPDVVDNDAPPEWQQIGLGGSWAWHDHRAHWMGSEPPIGLDPGMSLPAQQIPLVVDGDHVEITVQTTLLPAPSRWPALFGLLIGLAVALFGVLAGAATRTFGTMLLAAAATLAGVAQFRSLPSETGPLYTWWLLPAIALACMIITILTYGRWALLQSGLAALAGIQLTIWAFGRRATMTRAVLPTDLPFWLDRMITGAALTGGATLTVVALLELFRSQAGATPGSVHES